MPKAKKWVTAKVKQSIQLGQQGIELIIWDKWGKKKRGTATVSVGGMRWKPEGKSKIKGRLSWNDIENALMK